MNADTNSIIRSYLLSKTTLTDIVGQRIYCPRLPKDTVLPALGFFTRGGTPITCIREIEIPSVQFDCWAESPIAARLIYSALCEILQDIQLVPVTFDGHIYSIIHALREVEGQDLVDIDIPNYFRVLTYFKMVIRAE